MLREFFPAATLAFDDLDDLDAPDTLERLGPAPDPVSAARLSTTQITATLKRGATTPPGPTAVSTSTCPSRRPASQPPAPNGSGTSNGRTSSVDSFTNTAAPPDRHRSPRPFASTPV
jgi:hypothetical protein